MTGSAPNGEPQAMTLEEALKWLGEFGVNDILRGVRWSHVK